MEKHTNWRFHADFLKIHVKICTTFGWKPDYCEHVAMLALAFSSNSYSAKVQPPRASSMAVDC